MNCPNCQTPLREGAQFCTGCGARTSPAGETAAESVPTAEPAGVGVAREAAGAESLAGRVLDGKYEIVGRLGEGGMGAVYRARRVHIGDEVAVKVLHTKFVGDPTLVERFRREARAAAQLHHHNVVTIHDYGEAHAGEGFAYIVMELVRGFSLRELLRREGRLSLARAAALVRDICAGVGAAHRRDIVHRDLKPDNIIVLPADDDRERESVKVVDFGIAKLRDMASDSTLTQAGSMVGTPFYMSPEQCRGESLDARADVYSLGAMLYEMLAGAPPFTAPTVTGVIAKHLTEAPPPLPEGLDAPPALQRVIARALSKDPEARQRDAAEFAREVQAAAAQTDTQPGAPAPPPAEQFFPATGQQVTPSAASSAQTVRHVVPAPQTAGQHTPTRPPAPSPHTRPHAPPPPPRKSRAPLYVALAVMAITAFGVFVGGALYYFGQQEEKRKAAANANAKLPPRPSPTPTPAATPTPRPPIITPAMERAEQKLLAGVLVSEADIASLTQNELRLLRQVTYARHGRTFQDPRIQQYLESRPWYQPRDDFTGAALSDTDRGNHEYIVAYEQREVIPPPDSGVVSRSVTAAIDRWVKSTRERDLNAHERLYAETLETFYQKQNVPSAQVIEERAKAFSRYNELKVEIDNVQITADRMGMRATAVFDKKWEFKADDRTSTGAVRQQLTLAKVGGRWVITGERDLQVYSKSNEEY